MQPYCTDGPREMAVTLRVPQEGNSRSHAVYGYKLHEAEHMERLLKSNEPSTGRLRCCKLTLIFSSLYVAMIVHSRKQNPPL